MRVVVVVLGFLSLLSRASERIEYSVDVYSYDDSVRSLRGSHTYARFNKEVNGKVVEVVDISWLPAPEKFTRRGKIPLIRMVHGKNYTLEETREIAKISNSVEKFHGRFAISAEMYQNAIRRRDFLNSNLIGYKMIDAFTQERALNCIHALAGIYGTYLPTDTKHGEGASNAVIDHFSRTGQLATSQTRLHYQLDRMIKDREMQSLNNQIPPVVYPPPRNLR